MEIRNISFRLQVKQDSFEINSGRIQVSNIRFQARRVRQESRNARQLSKKKYASGRIRVKLEVNNCISIFSYLSLRGRVYTTKGNPTTDNRNATLGQDYKLVLLSVNLIMQNSTIAATAD
ncbi:hypothetical protein B296_00045780 [Ensete ventricosum]|uniref:Uncharacterized protein n=1 Tax=Ensete ventricosum TaxID=4639 RepID=A0A426X9V6_ENSVE|nr:hypothetical protein B296_00045780 [Ensete ventricosum]